MAFKFGRGALAPASLAAGVLVPLILIILFASVIPNLAGFENLHF
jgi:hypothetical protein